LPFLNTLFGVRVKLLLFVVKHCIACSSLVYLSNEFILGRFFPAFSLKSLILLQLNLTLSELFLFLFFCDAKLIISGFPELCEIIFFLILTLLLSLPLFNLVFPRFFYLFFQLSTLCLLFKKNFMSLLFSFCDLLIQNLFFSVLQLRKVFGLALYHLLSNALLLFKTLFFTIFL